MRASLPAAVVFPEPCRPASITTVGGFELISSLPVTPPSVLTSSSCTILMTCCAGLRLFCTSAPFARSLTRAMNCLTTLTLTSASSSARRISRATSSTSFSLSRPRLRRRVKMPSKRSERASNIGASVPRGRSAPARSVSRRGRRRTRWDRTPRGPRRASPMPTTLTGRPISAWIASTMPPFAVPSSLVSTTPVTSTASANCRAWARPFCPVVASTTSSTSLQRARRAVDDAAELLQLLHEVRPWCAAGRRCRPARGRRRGCAPRSSRRTRPSPDRRRPGPAPGRRRPGRPRARADRPRRRGTCRPRRARPCAPRRPRAARAWRSSWSSPRRSRRRTSRRSARRRRRAARGRPARAATPAPACRSASTSSESRCLQLGGARLHVLEDALGRRHADVGEEQRLFELVPGLGVDLALAGRARRRTRPGSCRAGRAAAAAPGPALPRRPRSTSTSSTSTSPSGASTTSGGSRTAVVDGALGRPRRGWRRVQLGGVATTAAAEEQATRDEHHREQGDQEEDDQLRHRAPMLTVALGRAALHAVRDDRFRRRADARVVERGLEPGAQAPGDLPLLERHGLDREPDQDVVGLDRLDPPDLGIVGDRRDRAPGRTARPRPRCGST